MQWDPQRYAKQASFVSERGLPVVDLLDPRPGEDILDLGCGEGALTMELVSRGARVVGIDASASMVEAACARGLDARVCAAEQLPFEERFDAVFTSAVLHWVTDQAEVLQRVHRSLRPGGRFVGEFAGTGNLAAIGLAVTAATVMRGLPAPPNPWRTRAPGEFARMLESSGFNVSSIEFFPRKTPLDRGLHGWLEVFGEPMMPGLPDGDRSAVIDEAVQIARPWMADDDDQWAADYVRLRFVATRN